jgi:hypothetical protein
MLGLDYGTEERLFKLAKQASALVFLFVGVFPVYWMAQSSLKVRDAVTSSYVSWFPTPATFTLENYAILSNPDVALYVINTIVVTIGQLILSRELRSPRELKMELESAEEYREAGDVADQVYKVLNVVWATHPFWVLRLSEIRSWIEAGEYDRIVRGEYPRQDEPDPAYEEDVRAAMDAYTGEARDFMDHMAGAARRMADSFLQDFRP